MMDNALSTWLSAPGRGRQYFRLNAVQWEAFMASLEAAPRPIPALQRLMREPSVFERKPGEDRS